jgi:hypothetical protein
VKCYSRTQPDDAADGKKLFYDLQRFLFLRNEAVREKVIMASPMTERPPSRQQYWLESKVK